MKYEKRLKNKQFEAIILRDYGMPVLELLQQISDDDFETILVFDPDSWNPYPEVTPPNISGNYHDTSHWLVQNKAGQMRSMSFFQDYGPEGCAKEWKHPEFGVIAFRKLPEAFKKD